ncbi:hypothetical protein J2Z42_002031 [Clostridium algifaecis]|uniref:Transporter suffix domain-containing protein n=1 Tax=Clostridium algifaecis TaxID=1472040 RepID=A0ABS4KTF5_9CLOT|nr:transporter suffix domain-containing protein [Clostridium algifaecis]MBP2033328.1 hypothetical protein [Clostridium algifaecis]
MGKGKGSKKLCKLATILFIIANVLWGLVFLMPFMPLSISMKAILIPVLAVVGEITLWISVALGGKELVVKYKKYFNPKYWFKSRKESVDELGVKK